MRSMVGRFRRGKCTGRKSLVGGDGGVVGVGIPSRLVRRVGLVAPRRPVRALAACVAAEAVTVVVEPLHNPARQAFR